MTKLRRAVCWCSRRHEDRKRRRDKEETEDEADREAEAAAKAAAVASRTDPIPDDIAGEQGSAPAAGAGMQRILYYVFL